MQPSNAMQFAEVCQLGTLTGIEYREPFYSFFDKQETLTHNIFTCDKPYFTLFLHVGNPFSQHFHTNQTSHMQNP